MTTESLSNPRGETSSKPDLPSQRRTLAIILGAALLGRLFVLWTVVTTHPPNWLFSNPWEMGFLADSLLHGHGYSNPFGFATGPTAFIAPGYPTLIAGIFRVFGTYTLASAVAIMSMHILVSLLTIWLIMHVARQMLDSQTATLAGTFWAISLPLLWIPSIFWESSLSECAVIGMIALALRYQHTPTKAHWIIFGASCAIIALINPALIFSLVAIMGWLAYQTRRVSRTGPLIGLLALLLVFAPWPIRNAYRFHAFIPLRSTVGFELWVGNKPGSNGRLDESVFPMYSKSELSSYISKGEAAYTYDKSVQGWADIRQQPSVFLNVTTRRFFRFWIGSGNKHTSPVYVIHCLLTTVFGFAGLVLLYRRRMRAFAILMATPLILFPVPYYITHAEFRYRLNIDPVLTVLAAYAVTQLAAAMSRKRSATPTAAPAALQSS
jgi:hypothetical protein